VFGLSTRALVEPDADRVLRGLGDPRLGEWREWTGTGYLHIRRRLSAAEQARVGPVADIRGTEEARARARVLGPRLALVPPEVLAGELG
jgi:hypothetical protein